MSYEEFDIFVPGDRVKHRKTGEMGTVHSVDKGSYQIFLTEWLADKGKRTMWRHMREYDRAPEDKKAVGK